MRQQVLEDVQYSTYAGPGTDWGGDAVRPAFLAAAPSYELGERPVALRRGPRGPRFDWLVRLMSLLDSLVVSG